MVDLIGFLELTGQATGRDIFDVMGPDWDSTELFLLVEKGVVSSSYGTHGARYFRYPSVGSREEIRSEKETGDDELLMLVSTSSGLDSKQLQTKLGWSRDKFSKRMDPLLEKGVVIRRKEGVSWVYEIGTEKVVPPVTAHKPDLRVVNSPKPDPWSKATPIAHGPEEGRFVNPKHDRELSDLDKKIIEQIEMYEDDREIDNLAEDCDVGPDQRKAYMRSLNKLYGDGYIGKVVEGDNVMYCSIERV